MNQIPQKLRREMSADPEYKICLRKKFFSDHHCEPDPLTGKLIEWEHSMYFQGRQLQKRWAIIPICFLVHRGGMLDKTKNEFLALNRATDDELKEVSRAADWIAVRGRLNKKYGWPKLRQG